MTDLSDRHRAVLLAVQQALLGEVTPNLRAVTVEGDDHRIRLEAFFDAILDERDEEAMSLFETEVLALFPANHIVDVKIKICPEPELVPKDRTWAYHRKERLLD